MPVKKKKSVGKKTVKKAVKKMVKKAVSSKRSVKKTVKSKAAKPKKTVAKKIVKKVAKKPVKKVVVKKAPVKKVVAAKPARKSPNNPKPLPKKENMIQPNKITSIVPTHDIMSEPEVIGNYERPVSSKPATLLGALEFAPYQPRADESYMSELQREHFRKILMAWKQQLMQDVDTTVGHLKEDAVFYADPVDRASQEEGFNLELRTRDRERRLIKKIEQSLDLLNTNEYGFCEDCGAEIGIRRLEARPTAVKCIDCKTFQEIREKQQGN